MKKAVKGRRYKAERVLTRKFFGNVEYLKDERGHVVEIKASNGVFVRKRSHFLVVF